MLQKRRYVGLDLGKRTYEMAVIGKTGKVSHSNGRTSIEGRRALYQKLEATDKVAIEAGNLAFIMAKEIIAQVGCEVVVLNASKLALIYQGQRIIPVHQSGIIGARPIFWEWKTIRSIGMVEETRQEGEKITIGRRYFVSSLEADAEQFAQTVRSHWGIENSLHYVLDVAFGEDSCRIRTDKGPENMAFIRKIALTLARSDKESKSSMVGRLKEMGWDNDYLEQMLFNSGFGANSAAG
ncbi:hypothetical protein AGMMS4952_27960 [Spirochaetia bacterium]|nr:hypothetical protein AGMMS4952_27960 [Spirochaetia bacterium]